MIDEWQQQQNNKFMAYYSHLLSLNSPNKFNKFAKKFRESLSSDFKEFFVK